MSRDTYVIVKGKKIAVSEIVSDINSLHPLLGNTKNDALCNIIYKLCQKIVEQKVYIQAGINVEITGMGTKDSPYRVAVPDLIDGLDPLTVEGGHLLGRYSVLDGEPQNIILGNNLVLDPITGVLDVVIPPPTPADGPDLNYTHNQMVASASWTITHNLGKYPSVTVVDSAGTAWEGDITYINNNSLQINFSLPFSGKAYLN